MKKRLVYMFISLIYIYSLAAMDHKEIIVTEKMRKNALEQFEKEISEYKSLEYDIKTVTKIQHWLIRNKREFIIFHLPARIHQRIDNPTSFEQTLNDEYKIINEQYEDNDPFKGTLRKDMDRRLKLNALQYKIGQYLLEQQEN